MHNDGGDSSSRSISVDARLSRSSKHNGIVNSPSKKHKSTYYARKDEIQELRNQIQRLQERLANTDANPPPVKPPLPCQLVENVLLGRAVERNSLVVAGTQSLCTAYNLSIVQSKRHVALKTHIHLPVDLEARQHVLASMYESKLLEATQFMNEQTRYLDLRVTQKQVEHFELADGDTGVIATDIVQFNGGHSLRQVYDALMFFAKHQEISVSEKLGILTINEGDDLDDVKNCQTRFLSWVPGGVEIESNTVMFATCVDTTKDAPAFAIVALDFVDQDDLYPYRPETCVRRELTAVATMHELPSLTGGPPSVAMARWSYSRIPAPQFPISEELKAAAITSMQLWGDIIPKIMKERLSTIVPARNGV